MLFSLKDKQAVVTGGNSGISLEIVKLFAQQGAIVHVLDLNTDIINKIANEFNDSQAKIFIHQCDISNQASVDNIINSILSQQLSDKGINVKQNANKIDILVNGAGIAHIGNIEKVAEVDLDKIYQVNIKGTYNLMAALIPHMKENDGGVILNMASVASSVGIPDRFAYSMSKGAVKMMTLSVARDYIDHKIRCNCISPARVHTAFVDNFLQKNYPDNIDEMFEKLSKSQPIGRMAKPVEVAYIALYLCSDEAAFITGSDFPVDGGFMGLR